MPTKPHSKRRSRIFAVGDIHGCLDKLDRLLAKAGLRPTDLLVFLGDYIDRGPDGPGVVDRILELRAAFPRVVTLMGNHEWMLLDYLEGRGLVSDGMLRHNGAMGTIELYDELGGMPSDHLEFFRGLSPCHETGKYIFVHAGLRPGLSLAAQDLWDMVWIREDFLNSSYDFGKTVVHGHTPEPAPVLAPGRIGIDTGAVYGGPLTGVFLPSERFVQVD